MFVYMVDISLSPSYVLNPLPRLMFVQQGTRLPIQVAQGPITDSYFSAAFLSFNYSAPNVTSVTPSFGPTSGLNTDST